ncbi:PREDICTED: probable Histone-lysine N-methyltransferase ATXR5 [Erythranthe guttata]|uniref:probable Histone-lysine N-methyltransferase ATXR5 n=1 Tax=Erythranthe guttata TaxID=4155 RepID=UPI00064DCFB1|nr:PREDICTED: probable Histone-lysine N-methyltransferase ATXR5 [Erythranthe guttata]|eukprot:XP_012845768.1 PREDICTED: probable Histone-lysine N-methyltransferase ATXR5 [Erythranthe guttata]
MDPCSIQVANGSQPPLVVAAGSRRRKKCRSMREIMRVAKRVDLAAENDVGSGGDYYSEVRCEECGSGGREDEMLLCNKCDRGHHMLCLRPIVTRVPFGSWICPACSTDNNNNKSLIQSIVLLRRRFSISFGFRVAANSNSQTNVMMHPKFNSWYRLISDTKKRRRRTSTLEFRKKRRRLLTHIPSQDPARRLAQMRSLAMAMTSQNLEYSNELTYNPSMAPRSANRSSFENGGMQILCKEDVETLKNCRALYRRGEFPPLVVAFDSLEGYTVQADGPIKDMTLIAEYAGGVDYIRNREEDDCDSMMTLLSSADPSKSLVACADKLGNISRFISGINNHIANGRKKLNIKCVRYNVDGECVVLLVANRDIAKGERLYYDYNSCEYEYPTHYFV